MRLFTLVLRHKICHNIVLSVCLKQVTGRAYLLSVVARPCQNSYTIIIKTLSLRPSSQNAVVEFHH